MQSLVDAAVVENRAMTQEEKDAFDACEKEIRALDDTIAREERAGKILTGGKAPAKGEEKEKAEERAFANYIFGIVEERAGEQNLSMGNNGAIVPVSIANRIIKAVKDRCPFLAGAEVYNANGILKIPVWGKANGNHDIAVGYQTEFNAITADAGKFSSVDLGGYLAGALALVGESLENNGSFDVVEFVVQHMAEEISVWIEGQLLKGTGNNQAQGALNTTNVKTAAAADAVTADELIELQASVKQAYQASACWTMHPDTFTALKKLKDDNKRYLLQDDVTGEFPFRLLGKPVFLSDNMPKMEAGAASILYGDYKGLAVNFRENINIKVLRERYADLHAIGVIGWFEFDAKVVNHQKLAVLKQKAE